MRRGVVSAARFRPCAPGARFARPSPPSQGRASARAGFAVSGGALTSSAAEIRETRRLRGRPSSAARSCAPKKGRKYSQGHHARVANIRPIMHPTRAMHRTFAAPPSFIRAVFPWSCATRSPNARLHASPYPQPLALRARLCLPPTTRDCRPEGAAREFFMANKMIIDASHPEETRVVVLKGNRVEEFDFEAASKKPLRGNIYLAKVTRVEPSLQAAFVDYGGNRHGFLAFSEIHPDYYQIPVADRQALLEEEARSHQDEDDEPNGGDRRSRRHRRPRPQEQQMRDGRGRSSRLRAGVARRGRARPPGRRSLRISRPTTRRRSSRRREIEPAGTRVP